MTDSLAALEGVELLQRSSRDALRRLADTARTIRLRPGEVLYREGDPPNHVFVVVEGSMEAVVLTADSDGHADEREVPVGNVHRPGELIGEIAVVRGAGYASTLRAVTVCRLLAIPSHAFLKFVGRESEVALSLARRIADRFFALDREDHSGPRPWVVLKGPETDARFLELLIRALSVRLAVEDRRPKLCVFTDVASVVPPDLSVEWEPRPADPEALLRRVQARHDQGQRILVYGHPGHARSLLYEADAVVYGASRPWLPPEEGNVREFELSRQGPASFKRVMVGRESLETTAARVARRLLRRCIGLALGGGAALGMAHLGVLDVLTRERIPFDMIAGTSAGALYGAFFLADGLEHTIEAARHIDSTWKLISLMDPGFFVTGQVKGDRLRTFLSDNLSVDRIEALPLPFGAKVLDLSTGDDFLVTTGDLPSALRASIALAGVFSPAALPDADSPGPFIDAGSVDNVPVEATRDLGADKVVGVHVISRRARPLPEERRTRGSPIVRAQTILQSQLLSFARNGERQVYTADVAVLPNTQGFGFADYWRIDELVETGRKATREILDRLNLLDPASNPPSGGR